MVQRAAGWSSAPSTPQLPAQFHWPATADTSATPPARSPLRSAPSDASPRLGGRSFGLRSGIDSAEASALKLDSDSDTTSNHPPEDSLRTIQPAASASIPAAGEGVETAIVRNPGNEVISAESRPPTGLEALTLSRPVESTSPAPIRLGNSEASEPKPAAVNFDDALPFLEAPHSPEIVAGPTPEHLVRPLSIDRAADAMNETLNEPSNATQLISARSDFPVRLPPAVEMAPPRSARFQSRAQESPPPVEVKIGSIEIVFDQPAAQPARHSTVRPEGFAEFADLRRYATRPWSLRSR